MPACCVLSTVAELAHTLPEGERIFGVSTFRDKIYVLRWRGRDQVEVYDAVTFALQRCLHVHHLRGFSDMTLCHFTETAQRHSPSEMTLCQRHQCLYIGDNVGDCVHKVQLSNTKDTHWSVHDTR